MTTPPRKPLYYTFGNHMHWVDMQWLWGYEVLPGSVRDMLHLCRETGAKGCVNFDAIGYEKMAAECPEALAELRDAVQAGTIEPVGCSYGQPYGLFQGGESNIRQFTYGVRSTRRLLGVRPKTFWEEEFYFFPQLPQILTSCGYTGASLFFQWTWHTPEVPKEPASLILWEGADATRIPTLPRNALNVHQWPEDFDGLLDQGLINDLDHPAIVQWLELMPSKDWMCRSEVLLPRLKELFADPRFDLRPRTCAELIAELVVAAKTEPEAQARVQSPTTTPDPSPPADIPIRAYTMDQVWHGMTLGKNADRHPRRSREVEHEILAAESLSALAGLFGRPYASWDVYPTWELDEAWRELLAAQHHDNHECEGLCGFVGYHQMDKADALAVEVLDRTDDHIARRIALGDDTEFVTNTLGWPIDVSLNTPDEQAAVVSRVPPFGHAPIDPDAESYRVCPRHELITDGHYLTLRSPECRVRVDTQQSVITQLTLGDTQLNATDLPIAACRIGNTLLPPLRSRTRVESGPDGNPEIVFEREWSGVSLSERIGLLTTQDGVRLQVEIESLDTLEPGFAGAMRLAFGQVSRNPILADSPWNVDTLVPDESYRRKYPTGDWMTSDQWFESVQGAFTANRFCEFETDAGRLLIVLDAPSQGFLRPDRTEFVIAARDPWDEARCADSASRSYLLLPGNNLDNAARVRRAEEYARFLRLSSSIGEPGDIPATWGSFSVEEAPGVLAHAFFRDSPKSGEHLPDWAGHRMAADSDGACTHPYAVRLVEWNAEPAEVVLKLPGPIAGAAKTNCMGECGDWPIGRAPADAPAHLRDTGWLTPEPATPPDWADGATLDARPIPWSQLRFPMRPREIATVMADLVMGRKQFRDLDAKREVWATVHRTEG